MSQIASKICPRIVNRSGRPIKFVVFQEQYDIWARHIEASGDVNVGFAKSVGVAVKGATDRERVKLATPLHEGLLGCEAATSAVALTLEAPKCYVSFFTYESGIGWIDLEKNKCLQRGTKGLVDKKGDEHVIHKEIVDHYLKIHSDSLRRHNSSSGTSAAVADSFVTPVMTRSRSVASSMSTPSLSQADTPLSPTRTTPGRLAGVKRVADDTTQPRANNAEQQYEFTPKRHRTSSPKPKSALQQQYQSHKNFRPDLNRVDSEAHLRLYKPGTTFVLRRSSQQDDDCLALSFRSESDASVNHLLLRMRDNGWCVDNHPTILPTLDALLNTIPGIKTS